MKYSRKNTTKCSYDNSGIEHLASKILRNQTSKSFGIKRLWHRFIILILTFVFRLCLFFLTRIRTTRSSKSIPRILIYSLTPEQIFYNGSADSLISFLNEKRFGHTYERSEYLVESRRFLDIFRNEGIVTPDISMHIIISCLDAARLKELSSEFKKLPYSLECNKSLRSLKARSYFRFAIDFTLWKV